MRRCAGISRPKLQWADGAYHGKVGVVGWTGDSRKGQAAFPKPAIVCAGAPALQCGQASGRQTGLGLTGKTALGLTGLPCQCAGAPALRCGHASGSQAGLSRRCVALCDAALQSQMPTWLGLLGEVRRLSVREVFPEAGYQHCTGCTRWMSWQGAHDVMRLPRGALQAVHIQRQLCFCQQDH